MSERKATTWSVERLLAVFYLLLQASNNLLYLSALTAFLSYAGADNLPWVYLLVNIGFITIQFKFMGRIVGREGHWFLSRLSLPIAIMTLTVAMILPSESVWLMIAIVAAAKMTDLITNQAFTAMINHFLSMSQARKALPTIYATGSMGYILSGLLLRLVIDFVGLRGLLLGNGFIVMLAATVLWKLRPFEEARLVSEAADKEEAAEKVGTDMGPEVPSYRHPMARLINISSFLIIFNRYLIDFLFAAAVSSYFVASNDLASFMGVFGATADFTVIGLQTFVMHRVFAAFSVGLILTFMPAVLTIASLLAAYSLEFAVIVAVQFFVVLNSRNFTVPSTTLLMGAIPQKERVYYRRDMSVACSIASLLVGVFLLLARGTFSHSSLFFLAAMLFVAMGTVHYLLDKAYIKTLKSVILKDAAAIDSDVIGSLRFLQQSERFEQFEALLGSSDHEIRLKAIEEVSQLPPSFARKMLEPLVETETDPRCLAVIARSLMQTQPDTALAFFNKLLATTSDNRLRADVIETLGKLRAYQNSAEALLPYLEHPHHRVQASAVISLIRLTREKTILEKAIKRLAAMAKDSAELMRASAAAVMGELGLPLFVPGLFELASGGSAQVANTAIASLARIHNPSALSALEKLSRNENQEISAAATRTLRSASRQSAELIGRMLPGITASERQKLAKRLRGQSRDNFQEILAQILCVDNARQRSALIALLPQADTVIVDLLRQCIIQHDEGSVELTIKPIFDLTTDQMPVAVPDFAALAGALKNHDLEELKASQEEFQPIFSLLHELWRERIALSDLFSETEMRLACERWLKRAETACQIIAFLASERATMLKSLADINARSTYARGMALEYLETRFGSQFLALIVPLLDKSFAMPESSEEITVIAEKVGVSVEDSEIRLASNRIRKFVDRNGSES